MSVKGVEKPKRYELVAPDGGWGYMIWIALTINGIVTIGFLSCVGMLYNDIYIYLKMDSTSISLLTGTGALSVSIAGFITGPLLGCMSIRKLGMVAAIISNVGTLLIVYVNSITLFFLSYGILQSFGYGILVNLTYTMLNQYFVKKRMLTVALVQLIGAIVSIFIPHFLKWSSEEYGSAGTLLLVSGINMHSFVAIVLMQPVEWHLKKIEIDILEDKETEMKTLLQYDEAAKEKSDIPIAKLSDDECVVSVATEKNEFVNLGTKEDAKKSILREMFIDFRDVTFLKSYLLSNASIGLAISAFSDVIFMIMLPQALYFINWNEADVAWALSLINIGDLLIKVLFIFFNSILLKFGNAELYIFGLIMAFFTRLGMLWSENPKVVLIFLVLVGMSRSILTILIPLVIGDAVDSKKFTSAMGIFMLLYGIIFLILAPLIGAIRDLTNSYGTAFYIVTSCYGIVTMFYLIELLYKRNKDKRLKK